MIVVCKTNKTSDIVDDKHRAIIEKSVHLSELGIDVGKKYLVYGISFKNGLVWYLICNEDDCQYPKQYCSLFFDIIESTIPQGWEFTPMSNNLSSPAVLPAEWARDGHFMEPLVDEDKSASHVFEDIKRRLISWHGCLDRPT